MTGHAPAPGAAVQIRTGATPWPGGGPHPYAGRRGTVIAPHADLADDPYPVRVLLDDDPRPIRCALDEIEPAAAVRPTTRSGRPGRGLLTATVDAAVDGRTVVRLIDEHADGAVLYARLVVDAVEVVELVLNEADHALTDAGYCRVSRWVPSRDGRAVAAVDPLPAVEAPAWAHTVDVQPCPGGDGGALVTFERACGATRGHDASVWVAAEVDLTGGVATCGPAAVGAHVDTDALTPAQARELARFLTVAVDLVEGSAS